MADVTPGRGAGDRDAYFAQQIQQMAAQIASLTQQIAALSARITKLGG